MASREKSPDMEPSRLADPGLCDVCRAPTYEARCKIICRRCGYTRDCSDP